MALNFIGKRGSTTTVEQPIVRNTITEAITWLSTQATNTICEVRTESDDYVMRIILMSSGVYSILGKVDFTKLSQVLDDPSTHGFAAVNTSTQTFTLNASGLTLSEQGGGIYWKFFKFGRGFANVSARTNILTAWTGTFTSGSGNGVGFCRNPTGTVNGFVGGLATSGTSVRKGRGTGALVAGLLTFVTSSGTYALSNGLYVRMHCNLMLSAELASVDYYTQLGNAFFESDTVNNGASVLNTSVTKTSSYELSAYFISHREGAGSAGGGLIITSAQYMSAPKDL